MLRSFLRLLFFQCVIKNSLCYASMPVFMYEPPVSPSGTAGRARRVARTAAAGSGAAAAMSRRKLQQLVDSLGRSAKHCESLPRPGPAAAAGRWAAGAVPPPPPLPPEGRWVLPAVPRCPCARPGAMFTTHPPGGASRRSLRNGGYGAEGRGGGGLTVDT